MFEIIAPYFRVMFLQLFSAASNSAYNNLIQSMCKLCISFVVQKINQKRENIKKLSKRSKSITERLEIYIKNIKRCIFFTQLLKTKMFLHISSHIWLYKNIFIKKDRQSYIFYINQLMKSYIIIIFILTLATTQKIFLFGSVLRNDNNKVYQKIIEVVGKPFKKNCDENWQFTDCARVAVITSACYDSKCGQQEYNKGDDEEAATGPFFKSLGMSPKHININIDNYKTQTNIQTERGRLYYEALKKADIIYFNGGDQSRHVRCWFNDNGEVNVMGALIKERAMMNQVVIIGVSAGTAFQSSTTYGGGSSFGQLYFSQSIGLASNKIGEGLQDLRNGTDCLQNQENGAKMIGFGLIKQFQIDTHFDARGRLARLIPASMNIKMRYGVGIDQQACIFYENGLITVYGANGVFITDTSSSINYSSNYLRVKNIKLHYLTEGDRFDFKQNKFQTTKQLITKPSFIGYQDSSNILHEYQCTKLILSLIDQTGGINIGKTIIPEDQDYPITTPNYSFAFYKDSNTKGFKSTQGQKSAFGINLDISALVLSSSKHKEK